MKSHALASVLAVLFISSNVFAQTSPSSSPETPPWTNESEVGIATVSGNAQSETYSGKQTTLYQFDLNKLKLALRYLKTSSRGTDTARSWDGILRYDRVLREDLSVFASYGLESDVFAGYVQRNNADVGVHYDIVKTKPTQWFAEAGYRNTFTLSRGSSSSDPVAHIIRVYTEVGQELSETSSGRLWVEYLPNVKAGNDARLNSEVSLVTQINSVFALKVGYLVKYQSAPVAPATEYLDSFFTTAVVAKF